MLCTTSAETAEVVQIEGLSLSFPTADGPVHALQDISLAVPRGAFISLIGPSGCGKTTLLRVIADLEAPTAGRVTINGTDPESARRERSYGYVFQSAALYPWRTIARNVALPLEIMNLSRSEIHERVRENLALVDLLGFERKFPWQLSGGMQQRASIARALAVRPGLLLMDEPFGALDEIVRDRLNQQLNALWARTAKTVVFVTHSIAEAVYLSSQIVVMSPRPGRIHEVIPCDLGQIRELSLRDSADFMRIAAQVRASLRDADAYRAS